MHRYDYFIPKLEGFMGRSAAQFDKVNNSDASEETQSTNTMRMLQASLSKLPLPNSDPSPFLDESWLIIKYSLRISRTKKRLEKNLVSRL